MPTTSHDLPSTGLLRLRQVLTYIPISRSAWYQGVAAGRYPSPVRLSDRVSAYRVSDIRQVIDGTWPGLSNLPR